MKKLTLKNLNKFYENKFHAVKNFNFVSQENEFIVLVGPSGCGKTTTLRMIAGLEEANSGEILFQDKNLLELSPADRNIGMVFQNYALYPHLTVFDNISFPLKIKKINKKIIETKVNDIAKWLSLSDLLDRKPKQLSGGQRQRVALGRAIVRQPDIFLFDEPLSNLDAKLRITMRAEIKKLHKKNNGISIYVTHDQIEAMTMADKIIVMDKGEISQIGTPEEIYNRPNNKFVAEFIGSTPINLFEGEIVKNNDDYYFSSFLENDIKLSPYYCGLERFLGGDITLAIRPEKIDIINDRLGDSKLVNSEEVIIENIENLGYEYLITFETKSGYRKIITKENIENKTIRIKINAEDTLLFEENGVRISQ